MKTKDELLAIVKANCPRLTLEIIRDVVDTIEFEGGGGLQTTIDMQHTAKAWGITVPEVYYLINPVLK